MAFRLILVILLIGTGLFIYSLTLPYYFNQEEAENLLIRSFEMEKSVYYKKEAELRTLKVTLMDVGSGLMVATLVVLAFSSKHGIKTFADFNRLQLLSKTSIFIWANIAWLVLVPGTIWYYTFRSSRGDYPPFADSTWIPTVSQISGILVLLIPINLFILISTIKINLPTSLFIKAERYTAKLILWESLLVTLILFNLLLLFWFVKDGDHISILVNLVFTYILLTLRAGRINNSNFNKKG